jgi:hypothetical protein
MSSPFHPPWFNHPNNIWRRMQVMKLIIMQLSPWYIFLPYRPKYLPQHSVLNNPQSMFLPQMRDQVSHPYSTTGKIRVLYILILVLFLYKTGGQKILDWIIASIPRI